MRRPSSGKENSVSVYQRKDGRFVCKFKEGNSWKQKSFRTREEAEALQKEKSYDERSNNRLTVSESILLFQSRTKHARKTEQYYALILSRMDELLAGRYVDTLTRRDLEHFRDRLRKEWHLSAYSINRYTGKLIAAWRWCASEDFLEAVPWAKYRHLPEEKRTHWCGNFDDFRRVYTLCNPALQWAVRTCLALCLRPGKELISLSWQDVDLTHGKASIWMPKTQRQKTVYCPAWWVTEARVRAEGKDAGDPVCPAPRGGRYTQINSSWDSLRRRAGITDCPLYTVRHMAASLMLEAGADIAAVAAQLGHKDVTTTGAFYTHAVAGAQEKAAQDIPELPS